MSSETDSVCVTGGIPYREELARGKRYVAAAGWLSLALLVFAILVGVHPVPWPFAAVVGVLALISAFLNAFASVYIGDSFRGLGDRFRTEEMNVATLRTFAAAQQAFIASFRPHEGDVHRVLARAAYAVRKACEEENALIRGGLSVVLQDDATEWRHPEKQGEALARRYEQERAKARTRVEDAKKEFYRLRDSARSQNYKVPDSWTELAGAPDMGKGIPGPVFAEGANEQPGA